MGTYHSTNTAEAAYILHAGRGHVELESLTFGGHDKPIEIVLSEKEPGHIGQHILNWPQSEQFKYFATLNWLNLGIKNLKEANGCPR